MPRTILLPPSRRNRREKRGLVTGSTAGVGFAIALGLTPFVLDYLVAHEVAHLGHMDHGPRFSDLVERMQRHGEARSWLRKHGASLHRYGSEGLLPSANGRSPKRTIE